jgi:hypothetical protein
MEALIIKPASKEEADLLKSIVKKMKVKYAVVDDESKEDYALVRAMMSGKKTKKVSEKTIIDKLKS